MARFKFSGKISIGQGKQPFEREVEAESEKHARDKLYSMLGSEHSISRGSIRVEESEEV